MMGLEFVFCTAIAGLVPVLWFVEKKLGLIFQMFHKVDETSMRHGGELVADVLKASGVKFLFTLSGGHISPILVSSEKAGIRVVDTRHEVAAVFAADAVARLSGTLGCAAVTAGPGLTNTVTAVKNAQMAESPVLLMGGAAATLLKGRGSLQDIDQMSLFKPICKHTVSITKVRDIVPELRKAIQIAQSGTPGPVFVEFPIDILYPFPTIMSQLGAKPTSNLVMKVINWFLVTVIKNQFAGGWMERDVSPLPPQVPVAAPSEVDRCVEMLTKAKKPVIVLGSQVTLPPVPASDLRTSLEALGVPCFLGGMSRGLLGQRSPIQCRQKRGEALKEADLIVLAGAVCDFRLSYGRSLGKKAKIIAVNRDKVQLYKNSDMFWKPTIAVQADAADLLTRVQKAIGTLKLSPDWLAGLKAKDEAKELANEKQSALPTEYHLNPLKVLHKVEEVMEDNTIMVADGGDFVGTASYILRPRGPLQWLDPGAFGTLGVGGGFALGAKLSRPDCDVWVIYGDGSVGYSMSEFDTYTRHKTPVIAVVGNDAGWTQISREQVPMFGSNVACGLEYTDYHVAAQGFGAKGIQLNRDNEDKMEELIKEALTMSRQGHSVLVNTLIGKTNFREGSISV